MRLLSRSKSLAIAMAGLSLALTGGCGGGGGAAVTTADRSSGTLTLALTFPASGRSAKLKPTGKSAAHTRAYAGNIPLGTQLVKLVVTDTLTHAVLASKDVKGPTSTGQLPVLVNVTIPAIPAGTVTVTATAYPDAAAAKFPIAVGSVTGIVQPLATTNLTVLMALKISTLTLSPTSATITTFTGSNTVTLQARAQDASENTLVVPLIWTTSDPGVASLSTNPTDPTQVTITGVAPGTSTITVNEPNSGFTGTSAITVIPD